MGLLLGRKGGDDVLDSGKDWRWSRMHPSFLVPEDGAKADCPQLFMPAGNDPPIDPIFDALNPDVKAKSKKKLFAEMDHGWSLRSDMSDPEAKGAKMANEAIEDAIGFLNQNL